MKISLLALHWWTQKVFDKMNVGNIVVWNAPIAGYVEQELNQQAME